MNIFWRISKFISKIGIPEQSPTRNVLNLLAFLGTKPGMQFVIKKIKYHLFSKRKSNPRSYHNHITHLTSIEKLQAQYDAEINNLKNQPLISVVMFVSGQDATLAVKSLLQQLYTNYECSILNIAQDEVVASEFFTPELLHILHEKHIPIHTGNINNVVEQLEGSYLLFMDEHTILTPNCLFEFVKHINANPDSELIYTDGDTLTSKSIYENPLFKPDWSPDNLLTGNYIGNMFLMKRMLMDNIAGINEKYQHNPFYDLLLRATYHTQKIGHIPMVLYHKLQETDSIAVQEENTATAISALQNALEQRNTPGIVSSIKGITNAFSIRYNINTFSKVSIIIPTKDNVMLLQKTLDSIILKTDYPDFEIILLNNNSTTPEFFDLVQHYTTRYPTLFRCYEATFPFNFSKLINFGVSKSSGKYLLFLNNDVEILQSNWMELMVSYAQRPTTGAVGVKLLYPDNTIQHAGIALGPEDASGHVYVGYDRSAPGYMNRLCTAGNYSAVTAACMMCRREVFDAAHGMDELLEVEYNDIDFCLKLLIMGYYNVFVPQVELIHHESASRSHPYHSKKAWRQHHKDLVLFKGKWGDFIVHDTFYNAILLAG